MSKSRFKKFMIGSVAVLGTAFVGLSIVAKKKKGDSVYDNEPEQKNPMEGKKVIFEEDARDKVNADGIRGHLVAVGESEYIPGFYEKYVKRGMDIALSFGGLVALSPVFAAIAIATVIDDPGPIFFTQKRVGQNKQYFKLHKFRSMKMCTPHDVPTHMLENPEQYITRVGKFCRRHSLDELPQIWDIFVGNMSVIGPRPGLWNQDLLTFERDKYGANNVKPGLTGWAQINGRDELEIPDKAVLDGEYVKQMGPAIDAKIFLRSLHVFGRDDSVVEGGTGELKKGIGRNYTDGRTDEELIGNIGFGEPVIVDLETERKVLITGAGSYIGESFRTYASEHYPALKVDAVDMLDSSWRETDFSAYDIVYHVAGIAHADVGNVDDATRERYYAVNTDLAVEVCQKAKTEGVKKFIFMSSMIVYGESAPYGTSKVIDANTVPKAANFYGDSKLQADVAVRSLADESFKVIVLRPPMIYGANSKGNYPMLAKLAKKLPVFPNIDNQRSMLHIDNLCECLCQLMLVKNFNRNAVVLVPQNSEWTKTSDMVKAIAEADGKNIHCMGGLLTRAVKVGGKMPGKIGNLVNKAFGNSVYAYEMSEYEGLTYQKIGLKESIDRTEKRTIKKVLFLVNHDVVIYNFRLELVERLLNDGYEVHISSPYGERIDELINLGAIFHEIEMERHGMNPINEARLLLTYRRLFAAIKPDIVLGYTIKPNIYGALVAGKMNIPFVANITGLGMAVETPGFSQKLSLFLYRIAFRKVRKVFFQNTENQQFFIDHRIAVEKHGLLPGSGVNLERFPLLEYPNEQDNIKFLFIGRIMKDKGIDELIEAMELVSKQYPFTELGIIGWNDGDYKDFAEQISDKNNIVYYGPQKRVNEFIKESHCVVLPSYHEGMANVLLEAASSGRPVIASDIAGCRETFDENISGFACIPKSPQSLADAMIRFIEISYDQKKKMGINGRVKMQKTFDRNIIVNSYMEIINNI